jgi:hypothetical protein
VHGSHAKANEHASNQHMNRWRLPRSLQVIATAHHARARMNASHGWTHTHVEHHPHTNVRLHTCAYTHTHVPSSQPLYLSCASHRCIFPLLPSPKTHSTPHRHPTPSSTLPISYYIYLFLYPKRLILLVIAAAAAVRRRAGYIITIAIIVALVSLTLVRLAPAYAVVTLGRCLLLILAAEPRGSSPSAPFVGGIHSRCEPITTSPIMHQPTHYLQSHAQAFNDYLSRLPWPSTP